VPADEMEAMTERYDDLPPIPVHVLALGCPLDARGGLDVRIQDRPRRVDPRPAQRP
jgi:hypothetical protein